MVYTVIMMSYWMQMPFLLSSLVGQSVGITLPAGPLLKSLVETLLLPLLLGKVQTLYLRHSLVTPALSGFYLCQLKQRKQQIDKSLNVLRM